MDITLSPQDAIETFEPQILRLLATMDHAGALVTDLSQISDFLPFMCAAMSDSDQDAVRAETKALLSQLEALLDRPVTPNEYLWSLGRDLYLKEQEQRAKLKPH